MTGARHNLTERWQDRRPVQSNVAPMPLTKRQADLRDFIADYAAQHAGRAPSFDEMAAGIGLKSKSGIHRLIMALEERGAIRRLRGRARAIAVNADSATARNNSPRFRA